mmetsp:Transcript_3020/g.10620  ORF Transcript_3020/g.10620 Transcript_3020/m.10620 type:complete len:86 (-) Transcript_3020:643-900(-)
METSGRMCGTLNKRRSEYENCEANLEGSSRSDDAGEVPFLIIYVIARKVGLLISSALDLYDTLAAEKFFEIEYLSGVMLSCCQNA